VPALPDPARRGHPDGATQFKCCPPIRDEANRGGLWAGLLDGTIDCVVSDHSPCPVAAKRMDSGDFGDAWGGIASVQLGLPAVWTEAARRGIGLDRVAAWMSAAPAALTGLADRGAISPGRRADFSVFAPDERFVVDPARLRQRNPVTPYTGRTLRGVVRQTWLAGRPAGPERRAGQLVRVPTGGVPAGPVPTGPGSTGPVPTGPVPTGPGSTGPVPTGPGSTGPVPTGPGSTGPGFTGSTGGGS
jgi:allantoinase